MRLDNNRMIHVVSGLEVGERVSLTPPLKHSGRIGRERDPNAGGRPTRDGSQQ